MAARFDFLIEQGADFSLDIRCVKSGQPVSLVGYAAVMEVVAALGDATPLLTLTTENGRIVITPSSGSVMLILSETETADLVWHRGYYRLFLSNVDGYTMRLLEGVVTTG